jgi:MoaD family protein
MPRIKVKYLNVYYTITHKKDEFIQCRDSITLRELIDKVSRKYQSNFKDSILDKENKLKPHTWILVNRQVTKDLDSDLKDGDVVVFSLPIIGG